MIWFTDMAVLIYSDIGIVYSLIFLSQNLKDFILTFRDDNFKTYSGKVLIFGVAN